MDDEIGMEDSQGNSPATDPSSLDHDFKSTDSMNGGAALNGKTSR
jgi:hypothetical protein